jgi:hypothetical protein
MRQIERVAQEAWKADPRDQPFQQGTGIFSEVGDSRAEVNLKF